MAVLNKIRQRSLFLILIIALALFSFVLADLFRNSDALTAKSQNVVATVNGKDITRDDFLQKVEVAQQQSGPNATNTQVVNRVWEQELRQAIMENQFEKLSITVEKDQMRDLLKTALASSPEFLNEAGLFDENKLNEYIANLKETSPGAFQNWVNYEKQLASNALNQNYFNMVKAGLTATLAEGELEHKLSEDKVDGKFVQIAYTSIADSLVEVSKSDIADYIKKNEKQYQVEASRDIRFVEFQEVASVEDEIAFKAEIQKYIDGQLVDEKGRKDVITAFSNVTDNEEYINSIAASDLKFDDRFLFKSNISSQFAEKIYSLNEGEVYGPYKENGFFKVSKVVAVKQIADSAKVRHILIPFIGAQSAPQETVQTEAQAKVLADSLFNVLNTNRSKFSEFVTEYSTDQGSVEKEGRYDWHAYNSMVPEFNDFEFGGKVGDLGVVKTVFGFHIIEIEGLTEPKKAVQVGTIARRIEPSEKTTDKIFRDASNFEINAGEGDFEAVAKKENFVVRPVNGIKILDEGIPGIGNQRPIVRWAFEEDVEAGDIKRFNIPGGYAVAQVVAEHKAGLMSVEEATVKVLPILRKEKKAEMIINRISAKTLEDIAAAEKTTVRSFKSVNMKTPTLSGSREPLVVGTAFGLKEGQTSKLIEGVSGVYMVQVTKVNPAVKLDNYQAAANRVEQQKSNTVNSRLYNALKAASEIEDNRAAIQIQ